MRCSRKISSFPDTTRTEFGKRRKINLGCLAWVAALLCSLLGLLITEKVHQLA